MSNWSRPFNMYDLANAPSARVRGLFDRAAGTVGPKLRAEKSTPNLVSTFFKGGYTTEHFPLQPPQI